MNDTAEPQPKRSSTRTVFWILALGGSVLLLSCGGCVAASVRFLRNAFFVTDPAGVRETAQSITDIDLPESYRPFMATNMGVRMAFFNAMGDRQSTLVLVSYPAALADDEKTVRQQMEQSLRQERGLNLRTLDVKTRAYLIRGEERNVLIERREDAQRNQFREIKVYFRGKGNVPAMLVLTMPERHWTKSGESEMESILASMR